MRGFGKVAGSISGIGILVGLAGAGLAAAVLGIGLLWLAVQWFTSVVVR